MTISTNTVFLNMENWEEHQRLKTRFSTLSGAGLQYREIKNNKPAEKMQINPVALRKDFKPFQ